MASGKFISLEGGDGSGKSTQIAMLAARLREAGLTVVETRDPGGTEGAEAIRQLVLTATQRNNGHRYRDCFASAEMRYDLLRIGLDQFRRQALQAQHEIECRPPRPIGHAKLTGRRIADTGPLGHPAGDVHSRAHENAGDFRGRQQGH